MSGILWSVIISFTSLFHMISIGHSMDLVILSECSCKRDEIMFFIINVQYEEFPHGYFSSYNQIVYAVMK